jgi:hypothetical protein
MRSNFSLGGELVARRLFPAASASLQVGLALLLFFGFANEIGAVLYGEPRRLKKFLRR